MTRFVLSVLFAFASFFAFAQTQTAMNEQAAKSYQKADKELNAAYQNIIKEYSTDPLFIKNLKLAQKAWIQFRDAQMKARYPDRGAGYYGSAQPMCWYNELTNLTQERTKALQVWLTGIDEGDVCAGSVKGKQ